MFTTILSYLVKQGFVSIFNNKKVDLQLGVCLGTLYMEIGRDNIGNTEYMTNLIKKAFAAFDNTGNTARMYACICYLADRLISKEEYYRYVDSLVKKMIPNAELATYIDVHEFQKNSSADFNPAEVIFEKTKGMLLNDVTEMKTRLMENYKHNGGYVYALNCFEGKDDLNLEENNLSGENLLLYECDEKMVLTPLKDFEVNKKQTKVTFHTDKQCNVIFTNHPFEKRPSPFNAKSIKENELLLQREKDLLSKYLQTYKNKSMFYTAIKAGTLKILPKHLEIIGNPKSILILPLHPGTLEDFSEALVKIEKTAENGRILTLKYDCHVCVLAGSSLQKKSQ